MLLYEFVVPGPPVSQQTRRQITDSVVRRRDLGGEYAVRSLTPVLAAALDGGREFLYVAVSTAPNAGELP